MGIKWRRTKSKDRAGWECGRSNSISHFPTFLSLSPLKLGHFCHSVLSTEDFTILIYITIMLLFSPTNFNLFVNMKKKMSIFINYLLLHMKNHINYAFSMITPGFWKVTCMPVTYVVGALFAIFHIGIHY